MTAKEQLKNFKTEFEVELKKYLDGKVAQANKISVDCGELVSYIAEITLRSAKRVRAATLYYSYIAHGGTDRTEAMRVSVAMELMQTFLLIHDDIIDNDSLRRGGPTMHKIYQNLARTRYPKANSKSIGNSTAILAGDLACAYSNEIIVESKFDKSDITRALREFNRMYELEYYGEFLDILSELKSDTTKDDVILTHQLKTVPYTFDGPIKIGAILAGIPDEKLTRLEKYSTALGTAFQIHDDYLGMFGTVEKTGKPITSDLKEGKRTLLILDALKKADKNQAKLISDSLGNKKVSIADLKKVRQVIVETGSLAESEKIARTYVLEAIDSLESMNLKDEGKNFLLGIANWMIERES